MAARGEVDKEEGNNSGFMGEYGERGRYRNRVEFKVLLYFIFHHHISGRYRNRVEFKVISRICLSITLSS